MTSDPTIANAKDDCTTKKRNFRPANRAAAPSHTARLLPRPATAAGTRQLRKDYAPAKVLVTCNTCSL